ncbi:MAG: tRNA lysidine(34) synthetase TilS [Verrucomicrobia bacterium]|nr:tRNA lysidine(34) synthetase TilS [Verrucomicrobiota bacterium]
MRQRQADIATRFPWVEQVKEATLSYPRQERHLVGVSGGVDSRVLLHLLPMIGFPDLVVCHLNHNLRGAESLEDSNFVSRFTRRLGLPLHIETLAELPGTGSLEMVAREARLQCFARAAENFSTSSLLLAHHADDQVETFLFNLFRGTGSLDNAAIKAESQITVGTRNLWIRRPMLRVWKEEIYEFAAAYRLEFREDSTNLSRQIVRNRIRHDLIPEIERLMGRPVKRTLLRTIELAASEGEFLRSLVPKVESQAELDVKELRELPVVIQRRTILCWLRHQNIKDFGFDEIEAVRSLLDRLDIARINLPRSVFCRRRAGRLYLQFPNE